MTLADFLTTLAWVLAVPALYGLGYLHCKWALSQERRDSVAVRRHRDIAERTRLIAARHGGNFPADYNRGPDA